jgi:hypothetical protein
MRREVPDHVPLWNLWRAVEAPFDYQDECRRASAIVALGLDDTILLQPPLNKTEHYDVNQVPGVRLRVHTHRPDDEDYPLLTKEYETPDGALRQTVRQTDDWPYGEDIRLFSDHNVSRAREFAVKGPQDLPALRHLLAEPSRTQVAEFRETAAAVRREAGRIGVAVEGGWTALGDAALWLLGTEALLLLQMDEPGFLEELLDIVCEWELHRMDYLLDAGVDMIVHSAWYECTDFWTPKTFRRIIKPRLRRLVERAHQGGALFSYIITTSWNALIDDLIDVGIDGLKGVDPVQGKADLAEAKHSIGEHVCLWGGINGALTLGQGTPQEIHDATATAIDTLGPGGGFILHAVDQVFRDTPWSNVEAMINCWRELASYPS